MVRKGKSVAKFDQDGEARQKSVILLSSSDEGEANGDLSLELVNRAREREAKRKRDEDLVELERRKSQTSGVLVNLSSSSSDEVEVVEDRRCAPAMVSASVPRKKRKSKKKKKKVEDKENQVNAVKLGEPSPTVEAVGSETAKVVNSVVKRIEPLARSEVVNGEFAGELSNCGKAEESSFSVEVVGSGVNMTNNSVKAEAGSPVVDITDAEGAGILDNSVLRKLLRGPRYFDPPESHLDTCFNCGKEGHTAANCTSERRKKPCFVCGNHGHTAKHCTQGQDCFICKRRGHFAKNCPEKGQGGFQNSKICLLCGDSGHDMLTCKNDYAPEDLKDIKCYICRNYGHLCCADIVDTDCVEVSCYNCGQSGHSGSGCAKLRGETSGTAAFTCFKCGEEGHFARGCTKSAKSVWTLGETSTPAKKFRKEVETGSKSVPPEMGKAHKKKMKQHEERKSMSAGKKPKSRGGWVNDDPGDLPYSRSPKKRRQRGDWIPDDIDDLPSSMSPRKPKPRGGWIPDDPVDSPYQRKKKGNSWHSPTPARWAQKTPTSASQGNSWHSPPPARWAQKTPSSATQGNSRRSPNPAKWAQNTPTSVTHDWRSRSLSSYKWQKIPSGSSGSQGWTKPSPHCFTASRFGSNATSIHGRGYE
ncbi:uncharacterized protein [Aristolochia californica]|uniref:uncharacterized protein n=1 Tax=Aristolochia californica TaxID=171875 RepID=UPI0035DD0454